MARKIPENSYKVKVFKGRRSKEVWNFELSAATSRGWRTEDNKGAAAKAAKES